MQAYRSFAVLGLVLLPAALWTITSLEGAEGSAPPAVDLSLDLTDSGVPNRTAYITAQCYTKTEDETGRVFNPCFTCHVHSGIPNYLDDSDLQLSYAFPAAALENPWGNLFEDRSAAVAAIGDGSILEYIRADNYLDDDGGIILAAVLGDALPANWDAEGDGQWDGYIPDAYFAFDKEGFDRDPEGGYTGWRAFGYYPFPGTFWPTNGSTDDVLIRLAAPFREDAQGRFDLRIYRLNLAIVESLITRRDVPIEPVEEATLGVDLDRDGRLATAELVRYDWAPLEGRTMSYVGRAAQLLGKGELHLAAGLFPEGTEFLHSMRYIDPGDDGGIGLAARMKELRYARKGSWYNYSELRGIAAREGRERREDPDALKSVPGDFERGMFTQGWLYQGFIEDRYGNLRPQSQEETLFCMGCHGGIGATTDTVFSFPRKFTADTYREGWYHWSQKGLAGIQEPRLADGGYEYSRYLVANGAGDEFRANQEVLQRFFDQAGEPIPGEIEALHRDIGRLLLPSRERALLLNKAYRVIVERQSFVNGRDATITPPKYLHRSLVQGRPTGVGVTIN